MRACATGADNGWKHLATHVVMSAHTFCGQSGQCFMGLWQGIASAAAAVGIGLAMARATGVETGATNSAPSMASTPRIAEQRWKSLFLTR